MDEIEVFVDITISTFNIANVSTLLIGDVRKHPIYT